MLTEVIIFHFRYLKKRLNLKFPSSEEPSFFYSFQINFPTSIPLHTHRMDLMCFTALTELYLSTSDF